MLWLIDAKKLTKDQAKALNNAIARNEPLAINCITLVEIAMLVSIGRLELPLDEFLTDIEANPIFRILPLTAEIASEIPHLKALADPADRTIVATARVHRLTLITSDQRILDSSLTRTIG